MISAPAHWTLVCLALVFFISAFSGTGFQDWRIAKKSLYWAVARQANAQGLAGLFWLMGTGASLWLGYECFNKQPTCGSHLIPILIFDKYMFLVGLVIVWVARNTSFRRAGLRRLTGNEPRVED